MNQIMQAKCIYLFSLPWIVKIYNINSLNCLKDRNIYVYYVKNILFHILNYYTTGPHIAGLA